ncbi:hypothetical protein SK128_019248 [Halocaridina rubra]|uniref:Uncharacterized protein n=1 Tax=Halocaridina rubra TaxID=373956 RepID=A0AAN8X9B0_HALRR
MAYKRAKSTTVQVARMVCITILAVAFMIGFFVITSNYLSSKQCDCSKNNADLQTAGVLPPVEKLVGAEELNKIQDMNNNEIDEQEPLPSASPKVLLQNEFDEIAVPDAQEELDDNIPVEEVQALLEEVTEIEEEAEREQEQLGIQDIMKQEIDDMKKKIKLPIDLILGNPSLAGRDVNCEVERRQHPIGGGIVTQAIIVTCSDSDDNNARIEGPSVVMTPPGPRRLGPPLSLLAPIMKMLTAKAMSRAEKPVEIKAVNIPFPMLPQAGPQPCSPNGPFPCFMNQPGPLPVPVRGPMPHPFFGPFPGPFPGRVNGPFPNPVNGPFPGPVDDPYPEQFSGPNPGPIGRPFPEPFSGRNREPINAPFLGRMPTQNAALMPGPISGSVSRQIHIPMNANIPPIPNAFPAPPQNERPLPSNSQFFSLPKSILQAPSMSEENDDSEDEPRNRMLPFALRPLVRITPRMPRILALATNPDRQGPQTLISSLQRGAVNSIPARETKIISSNLPPFLEPQRRALETPVPLPGLKFLPARILSAPAFMRGIRREEPRPITHMEMHLPEPESKEIDFEPQFPDFGPPRDQTIISSNQSPRIINEFPPNMPHNFHEQNVPKIVSKTIEVSGPIPIDIMSPPKPVAIFPDNRPIAGPFFPPPPLPSSENLPPPPPPNMDPEGRSGLISEVDPDAEIIIHSEPPSGSQPPPQFFHHEHEHPQSEDDRKHHLLVLN